MDNPDGKVPVLLDGDVRVPDSGAICEYLDEKYPEGGSLGEATVAGVGEKLFPSFVQFLKSSPEEQAEKEPALLEQLQQLNDYIEENGPYLCGDEMGAADTMMVRCTALPVVSRYPYLESTQTGTIGHHTPSNSISCKCTSMHISNSFVGPLDSPLDFSGQACLRSETRYLWRMPAFLGAHSDTYWVPHSFNGKGGNRGNPRKGQSTGCC